MFLRFSRWLDQSLFLTKLVDKLPGTFTEKNKMIENFGNLYIYYIFWINKLTQKVREAIDKRFSIQNRENFFLTIYEEKNSKDVLREIRVVLKIYFISEKTGLL